MSDLSDQVASYSEEIRTALESLKLCVTNVINRRASPATIENAIEDWEKCRQKINDQGIGLAIGVGSWLITTFELAGDIDKDLGQMNMLHVAPTDNGKAS